jgi:uncharacterized membrane protein
VLTSTLRFILASTLVLSISACSSDDGDGDGNTGPDAGGGAADAAPPPDANSACESSTLTYSNFGQQFMTDYCTTCHSVNSSNRRGAPSNYNFDTFADIEGDKARIDARAGAGSTMPPNFGTPIPSQDERDQLHEWLTCGPAM